MDLRDAVEQYVDMVTLGSQALLRLADQHRDEPVPESLFALVTEIAQSAERLRALTRDA